MKFVDMDGRAPVDYFRTINSAAKDWGKYCNGRSILRGKEYSSSFYSITVNGKKGHTYPAANEGTHDNIHQSAPPKGKRQYRYAK